MDFLSSAQNRFIVLLGLLVAFIMMSMAIDYEFVFQRLVDGRSAQEQKEGPTQCRPSEIPTKNEKYFMCTSKSFKVDNVTIPVQYQCRGQEYKAFVSRMNEYMERISRTQPLWGRRRYPLPDNTSVLSIGNSHTKQATHGGLVCQHKDEIESVSLSNTTMPMIQVRFRNNSTIYAVHNSPVVYSTEWVTLLEQRMGQSLESLDAVIFGEFNDYSKGSKTDFQKEMEKISAKYEEVEFGKVHPPDMKELSHAYSGPILIHSMFAEYRQKRKAQALQAIANGRRTNRSNIVFLDGRTHIDFLGECGSDGKVSTGSCLERGDESPYGQKPQDMHRCTGSNGGHPDLLAWDFTETLHQLIEK